ncbi:COX15/CtaA family protein [Halomonas aquamarina]|uniref:COX15/CtaA family protein n=1 Tax=Vreelandella aquamarina TaxID=77097 RepID=A0ACC5VUL6_9GAMM|nr:COX15/CtaA family protein [Halomonas aquamarina]MBZ5487757.1 COX15/CtaA family protein [Halomonas aquamarina]
MQESIESRLKWLLRLTLLGTLLTILVILVGAWTRLVDAGLGCPDWPGCYGRLVVPSSEYAAMRHPDVPLDASKAWVEMAHRYIATLLGMLVIGAVTLGWSLRKRHQYPWRTSLLLLAVIIVQGAFGAFTVTLKLWPQVVTLHLLGGFSVLILFLWLHLRLRGVARQKALGPKRTGLWWGIAAGLLVLQLALGGWVTSNYAGIACQGIPTCNGQWWPGMDIKEGFHLTQTVGPNYLHGQLHAEARTAIHFIHRLGAVLLGLSLAILLYRYWHYRALRRVLGGVMSIFCLQVILGALNVLMWLPLWLALIHTAGAVFLAVALLLAWWQWRLESGDILAAHVDENDRAGRVSTGLSK